MLIENKLENVKDRIDNAKKCPVFSAPAQMSVCARAVNTSQLNFSKTNLLKFNRVKRSCKYQDMQIFVQKQFVTIIA